MYLDSVLRNYSLVSVPEDEFLRKQLDKLSEFELKEKLMSYGQLHNTTDLTDRNRIIRAIEIKEFERRNPNKRIDFPEIDSTNIGIHFDRTEIRQRITSRLADRLENGMIDEVKTLLDRGLSPNQLKFYGLEYKWVTMYVTGEIDYNEMFTKLNTAIHQFAKRQMTWFRKMEKNGVKIFWIDGNLTIEEKLAAVLQILR